MKKWVQDLQTWSLQWANTKWGAWALFFVAYTDACCLPMPTPMFFLVLGLLNIKKVYMNALYGTIATLLGALTGYCIGYFAWLDSSGGFTPLAQFITDHIPGFSAAVYDTMQVQFDKWGFGILFVASFIPVPYKLFSISSGIFDINVMVFAITTLVSQGIKFYLLALLIVKIGPRVNKIINYKVKPSVIIAIATVVIFVIVLNIL